MNYNKLQGENLSPDDKHRSDGSELIPAEIQANTRHNAQLTGLPFSTSYTIDDEGLLNNYAVEPEIHPSNYPTPRQQWRYGFLGTGAILLVVTLITTAFIAS